MLRFKSSDREIESNMGSSHDILPGIFKVFKQLDPNLAQQCKEFIRKKKAQKMKKPILSMTWKIRMTAMITMTNAMTAMTVM